MSMASPRLNPSLSCSEPWFRNDLANASSKVPPRSPPQYTRSLTFGSFEWPETSPPQRLAPAKTLQNSANVRPSLRQEPTVQNSLRQFATLSSPRFSKPSRRPLGYSFRHESSMPSFPSSNAADVPRSGPFSYGRVDSRSPSPTLRNSEAWWPSHPEPAGESREHARQRAHGARKNQESGRDAITSPVGKKRDIAVDVKAFGMMSNKVNSRSERKHVRPSMSPEPHASRRQVMSPPASPKVERRPERKHGAAPFTATNRDYHQLRKHQT